jgi:hypothetical protein
MPPGKRLEIHVRTNESDAGGLPVLALRSHDFANEIHDYVAWQGES